MKILFIRPSPPEETIGLQHVMIVEPLELEILAAGVKEKHEVLIADLIVDKKSAKDYLDEFQPDVVCVTGYITHTYIMRKICTLAKNHESRAVTIVGGVHVEHQPETLDYPDVDYRVVRNAGIVFPKLINYLGKNADFPHGVLRQNELPDEKKLPEYDFYSPLPDRSLTKKYHDKYFYVFHSKVALLKSSFGCPYQCNFCYCRTIAGNQYFERNLKKVISELKAIPQKEIYIIDDNFLFSKKRLEQFLELLKKENIRKKYLIYGRADFIVENEKLLQKFKEQGLRTIIVGFESFSNKELNSLSKNTTGEINAETMRILNKLKIDCYASIIAMPSWSKEDFDNITRKLISLKVRFLNIQPLTPLLKTDIDFDENKLVIPRDDYPKWDLAHVVVQAEKMSVNDFYKNILRMYERVMFRPANLIHQLRYPLRQQIKLARGLVKVHKQYKEKFIK